MSILAQQQGNYGRITKSEYISKHFVVSFHQLIVIYLLIATPRCGCYLQLKTVSSVMLRYLLSFILHFL